MVSPKMPSTSSITMLVALLLMGAAAVLASPIATPYSQPASTSVSESTCPTTVITYQTLVSGPTRTFYSQTTTITSEYDCHGCEGLVVEQLGHIFPDVHVSYNATVTEYQPTTYIQVICSSTPGNLQTDSITVNTTETPGYTTITVGSKTDDMGLRDILFETKSKTISTPAAKRSVDFGGGRDPTRCIEYRTGKPIPGCNTAREVDERLLPPGSIYPAACWNPITGLFDPAQSGCKITSRSQIDGDATRVFFPLGLPNATKVEIQKECFDSCKDSVEIDNPPFTIAKLIACDIPCVNLETCGRKTTCATVKRAVDVENQERQSSNANATESCTGVCNFIATDPNHPDSTGLRPSPVDLAACVNQCVLFYNSGEDAQPHDELSASHALEQRHTPQCVECPADGSERISVKCPTTHQCVECPADGSECFKVDCTPAKRAVEEQIQERQNPQCLICPVNSDDTCFEVDCPADAGGGDGGRDEVQGDRRGVTPALCYSTCISKFSKPIYEEIHRCRLGCGLGPVCAGNDCVVVKRAADIEVEHVARQDSLYGHPGEDQVDGCHFDGMALLCTSGVTSR